MIEEIKNFEQIRAAENEAIYTRRGEPPSAGPPGDLFGVALSGGGIRSASFCLGALQALDRYDAIKRIDYLSTVSGGGYTGASMIAAMSRDQNTKFPFHSATAGKPRAGARPMRMFTTASLSATFATTAVTLRRAV